MTKQIANAFFYIVIKLGIIKPLTKPVMVVKD